MAQASISLHVEAWPGRFAAALAGSLLAHAVLLGALALLTGLGGSGPGSPFPGEPLRAHLVAAQPTPAPAEPTPTTPSPLAPTAIAPVTAPLPVPLRPAPAKPAPEALFTGRVTILPDDGAPLDEATRSAVASIYAGAERQPIDFEVAPELVYPDAARRERRQAFVRVVVVVRDDGTLEIAEGTFADPLFGPSIRAALASAKAKPLVVDGAPRPSWSVLTFYFEHYGSAESQRSNYEDAGK